LRHYDVGARAFLRQCRRVPHKGHRLAFDFGDTGKRIAFEDLIPERRYRIARVSIRTQPLFQGVA